MFFSLRRIVCLPLTTGFLLLACPLLRAQEPKALPWCNLTQLDFNLGNVGHSDDSKAHWLVINIRNTGEAACRLGTTYDGKVEQLAPAGEAHVLLAWSSVPVVEGGIVIEDCKLQNEFSPYAGVELRNLEMWTCGGGPISSYHAGAYHSGELLPEEWLQRVGLTDSEFTEGSLEADETIRTDSGRIIRLWAPWGVQYLKSHDLFSGYFGSFILFLTSPDGNFPSCPFRTIRKREADGETTIYVNHCDLDPEDNDNEQRLRDIELPTWVFGISPEKTGTVEYEVTAEAPQNGKPAWAESTIELSIHDPNTPMLPSPIETNVPPCKASQLTLTSPPIQLGTHWVGNQVPTPSENWYDAKVFEFRNTSGQRCMLGGVPELKFDNAPWVTTGRLIPEVCRNCDTPLFKPRQSRWIELQPNNSAHFIVARLTSYLGSSSWCNTTGGIEIILAGESLRLPFEANFCGAIPVSAWRAGKYDHDPMNVEYDRMEKERQQKWLGSFRPTSSKVVCIDTSKPKSQLPPAGLHCAEAEFAKFGKPAMSPPRNGIAFGVSSVSGKPKTLYVWLDNQTDKTQFYLMCCRSTFLDGIDIYDSAGRRLISKEEQTEQRICAESGAFVRSCSCGTTALIPPHSLQVVDSGDLTDGYVLSPGRYFIASARVDRQTCELLKRTAAEADGVAPSDAIMITVPE